MEIRCHLEYADFCIQLEQLLDRLAVLYSLSPGEFSVVYQNIPYAVGLLIRTTKREIYENTPQEDIADYCHEVHGYYLAEKNKAKQVRLEEMERSRYKPFTLRNPDDLKQFGEFLDKMLYILELSPYHFSLLITQCPTAYWDKIDDLRETSFKFKRDSAEYISCLEKCKKISFAYSDYAESNMTPEEDFIDDYDESDY